MPCLVSRRLWRQQWRLAAPRAAVLQDEQVKQRHHRLQGACGLLLLAASVAFLQGCGSGSSDVNCDNSIAGWTSKNGRTCEEYYDHEWCTSDGEYGDGWDFEAFGTFDDWANSETGLTAVDACCGCGGGVEEVSPSPLASPSPTPPPALATTQTPLPSPLGVEALGWLNIDSEWSSEATITVTCPYGTTLTSCTCHSAWVQCRRSAAVGSQCIAYSAGSDRVKALARCGWLRGTSNWLDVSSSTSGTDDDDKAYVDCPTGTALTGCSCGSTSAVSCDGVRMDGNRCIAQNGGGSGVVAQARCGVVPLATDWTTIVGERSTFGDDDTSEVACPAGYELTGCQCFSPWISCDGASISGNRCLAWNKGGGNGVYPVARCAIIPEVCKQSPADWTDSAGRTCEDYRVRSYCTADGSYGSSWPGGLFADYATGGISALEACCQCGGGAFGATTTTIAAATTTITAGATTTATVTSTDAIAAAPAAAAPAASAVVVSESGQEEESAGLSSTSVIAIAVGSVGVCLLCLLAIACVALAGVKQTGIKPSRVKPSQAKPSRVSPLRSRQSYSSNPDNLEGYSLHPVEDAAELGLLRELFTVTDKKHLGIGRDVQERGKYKDLSLQRAWRVVKPDKELVYNAKKSICAGEIRRASQSVQTPAVKTKLDDVAQKLGLDAGVNEKLLLHGTKPGSVIPILQNGLNERFSGGLFGSGIYLAEDPSKIDQYCTADDGDAGGDDHVEHLHEKLYGSGKPHPGGKIFYCFGVKVPLGIALYTKDGETDASSGKGIWATSDKRELVCVPGVMPALPYHCLIAEAKDHPNYKVKRHREFVTFNGDMTILEYVIAYTRVPK